ncbi:MAG: NAD(+) synthase [Flavobacteriales bacterium]|nr:NAD(+) synthase [Flavobacteriales bacterium]MBP9079427.1 NAD(+) synthase [Flavobacteriales bacterium]
MLNVEATIAHIVDWLRSYCTGHGQHGLVVGVSGGIDSAVVSTLCAHTGLPVLCVEMHIHQAESQVHRAKEHIAWLRERHAQVEEACTDLTAAFDTLLRSYPPQEDSPARLLALANTRARLRMTTLYYFAGIRRALVAGTGNKVEDFGVGFFTKYGDGGVDLSPIADLTKSEVYELAAALGVVDSIRQAKPTDGLFGDDRSDEDQLGASYPELEWAMALREGGRAVETAVLSARQREVLAIYDRLHRANAHKWKAIPVCAVPEGLRK